MTVNKCLCFINPIVIEVKKMIENRCDCQPLNQDLVDQARKNMPDFKETSDLSDFFKVMGDSTRLQLLIALQMGEFCVSDLSYLLNMTRSAVSHQLKALRVAKLIRSRKDGKTVYYALDDDHVRKILEKSLEHIQEK